MFENRLIFGEVVSKSLVSFLTHSVLYLKGCLQPTQLSWPPVPSHVASLSLRRKAATDNMLQIVEALVKLAGVC